LGTRRTTAHRFASGTDLATHRAHHERIDKIWFTRCPVPTATGLAHKLGWLEQELKPDGIAIGTLQEVGGEIARHHYDHQLSTLIREGGNLFAIPAKAQGAPRRAWALPRASLAHRWLVSSGMWNQSSSCPFMYRTGAAARSPGGRSSRVERATETYAPPISGTSPSV
jgi:hypothetical protein